MSWKLTVLASVLSAACVTLPYRGDPGGDQIERSHAATAPAAFPHAGDVRLVQVGNRQIDPLEEIDVSDLRVVIEGVRSDAGTIMIGLYDEAEGFKDAIKRSTEIGLLNDKGRLAGAALRAARGRQSIVFSQLHPGRYAVIVFHDENDNGRLDENGWGVPVEGYGFSNNAQGVLGAPSFEAAEVTLAGKDQSIAISLVYPKVIPEAALRERPD